MIKIFHKKNFLTYAELYFSKARVENIGNVNFARYVQSEQPISNNSTEFHTLILDITKSEEFLFSNLKKNCRNEIRKARNSKIFTYKIINEIREEDLLYFQNYYDTFAKGRGLPFLNYDKLVSLCNGGNIIITYVKHLGYDKPCAMHCYIRDQGRCRLLYSGSDNEQIEVTGLANRFLHWNEFLEFKKLSINSIDFGGISDRNKMNGIDKFKQQFGGKMVTHYNDFVGVTGVGKFIVRILRTLKAVV